jgi:hypothetical protein
LDGVKSLRELAVKRKDMFALAVIENLMTYAIGRGVEVDDMPMLRQMARDAAKDNYRFSTVLMGVLQSPAFTKNMKASSAVVAKSE